MVTLHIGTYFVAYLLEYWISTIFFLSLLFGFFILLVHFLLYSKKLASTGPKAKKAFMLESHAKRACVWVHRRYFTFACLVIFVLKPFYLSLQAKRIKKWKLCIYNIIRGVKHKKNNCTIYLVRGNNSCRLFIVAYF